MPKTLEEAIIISPTRTTAVARRWPDGVRCVYCDSPDVAFIATRGKWRCRPCNTQFSVKVGTIFEDSPIRLRKWYTAVWMLLNCKNGVSSYEISRALNVTQKTAWFMLHRIRAAIKAKSFDKKLSGIVESDESFVGGLFKNMHKSRKERVRAESEKKGAKTMPSAIGKTLVQAVLERDGEIRTKILQSFTTEERMDFLKQVAEDGAQLMTDEGYTDAAFGTEFIHQFVNHAEKYIEGNVHCNGVENFWSLLSRMLHGTYVDEQAFRFNNRKDSDGMRFLKAMAMVPTARHLQGSDASRPEFMWQALTVLTEYVNETAIPDPNDYIDVNGLVQVIVLTSVRVEVLRLLAEVSPDFQEPITAWVESQVERDPRAAAVFSLPLWTFARRAN